MNKIFNSDFEISLRILLILKEYNQVPLTLDTICNIDFISIYSKEFNICDDNLHGNNIFRFSEFITKKQLISRAIKILITKGYVDVNYDNSGFKCNLTKSGLEYCNSLNNNYSKKFSNRVSKSRPIITKYSELELINIIKEYAIYSSKKECF